MTYRTAAVGAALGLACAAAAPTRTLPDAERAFRLLHGGATDLPVAELAPDPFPGHSRWCRDAHPPAAAGEALLPAMREVLRSAQAMAEDHQAYFAYYSYVTPILQGDAPAPAGLCAAFRGAREGSAAATSYAGARGIFEATFRDITAQPYLYLGPPDRAAARTLRVARVAARDMAPVDARLVLKASLQSVGRSKDLAPNPRLRVALVAAGDASIIPDWPEGAAILEAVSAAAGMPGLAGDERVFQLGLAAHHAGTTPKGRYWITKNIADQLLFSKLLTPAQAEIVQIARDKAFAAELPEGGEILRRLFVELLTGARR